MIDPVAVQASIISMLKAAPAVTAIVDEEIREDNWMGTKFVYPAVRVAVNPIAPMANNNGNCRYNIGDVSFTVSCYAEGSSSKGAANLAGQVADVFNAKLVPNFKTVVGASLTQINMPVPEGERLWRADVQARTTIKE